MTLEIERVREREREREGEREGEIKKSLARHPFRSRSNPP